MILERERERERGKWEMIKEKGFVWDYPYYAKQCRLGKE